MGEGPRPRWWSWSGSLEQRSLRLSLVPLVLAAATAGALVFVLSLARQADDEVQRGLRALGQIHAVHAALAEAASGVRGYLITRDETFLRPYHRAGEKLEEALARLDEDVRDPWQREQLAEISRLVTVKLATLEVLTSRSGALSDGEVLGYSRDNKALLDAFRQRIAAMEAREHRIIAQLQRQQQRTRQAGLATALVIVLAAFVLASVLSRGFAVGLIRRIRHLRDNARRIGRRAPLAAYPGQHADELAELDRLLVATGETLDANLRELEAARHAAEQASHAKTRFLSRTSHELRTPLNAVIGFSGLLRDQVAEPAQRRQLEAIERSAEHLLHLVNDLLDMSRIEAGQVQLTCEQIELAVPVGRALEIVQGRAALRGVSIEVLDVHALPPVRADTARVTQVLINLLDNAVKFGPAGGGVRIVGGIGSGGVVQLRVTDEGPGVPASFVSELFQPFSRQEGQHEGHGLGLAISHGLMQMMGGGLSYRQEEGGGGCFVAEWPADAPVYRSVAPSPPAPRGGAAGASVSAPVPGSPSLVLASDDDAFSLQLETTAQRLGLDCWRLPRDRPLPVHELQHPWLLVLDAAPGWSGPPTLTVPPLRVISRGPLACRLPVPVTVVDSDAPASVWRRILQESVDECIEHRSA